MNDLDRFDVIALDPAELRDVDGGLKIGAAGALGPLVGGAIVAGVALSFLVAWWISS